MGPGRWPCGRFLIRPCDLVRADLSPPWPWWVPGRTIHQVGWSGMSREARGSHGGPFWILAVRAYVSPGPLWRTYVLVGRLPGCPAVPYFGDVLGDCPLPGPTHPLNAGQSRTPFLLPLLKPPSLPSSHTYRSEFASAASRRGMMAAYVRGTELIRGFSLRPRLGTGF
jgi:hypothetical protein